MQPHRVPAPRDHKTARAHLRANVQAATASDTRAGDGHWHLHHIALPADAPGDFTPYRAPDYTQYGLRPFGEWLEALAEAFGPDQPQAIAQRGLEAGQ